VAFAEAKKFAWHFAAVLARRLTFESDASGAIACDRIKVQRRA